MHTIVRRYIKTAITFLVIGLALGVVAIWQRELGGSWPSPHFISAHTHAILVGFVMMMIQGVALWLFPRPEKDDTRYDPRLAQVAYWLMTIGTGLRLTGEVWRGWNGATWLRALVVTAALLQVGGITVFFHTMWSRVRAVGSAVREARGERF